MFYYRQRINNNFKENSFKLEAETKHLTTENTNSRLQTYACMLKPWLNWSKLDSEHVTMESAKHGVKHAFFFSSRNYSVV